ncbi:MAG: hypothetical protein Q7N50_14570 [Armatimonadota bacterium]|nr:hypothetical protein [Armatimonadota bacterium]
MAEDLHLAVSDYDGGLRGRLAVRVAGAFILFGGLLYGLNIVFHYLGDEHSQSRSVAIVAFIHFAVALGLWYRWAIARTAAITLLSLETLATLVSFPQMSLWGTQYAPLPFYPTLLLLKELSVNPLVGFQQDWIPFLLNIAGATLVILLLTGKAARAWCNRRA